HAADQPDRAGQRLPALGDGCPRRFDVLEDPPAEAEQRLARRGDAKLSAHAQEDLFVEFLLEDEDLPADSRLRQVEMMTGGRERTGVGHGPEYLELAQVHGGTFFHGTAARPSGLLLSAP